MTMREIRGFLLESYGTDVSAEFISSVTEAVMAEVTAWQARPLEPMYPVVFFDALRVKIKEDALVCNKAIYLALGVLPDGTRDILGLWIEGTEDAKFWMRVFNDLKTRGVGNVLIAVTDSLIWMPPGEQEEFVSCCEEVGCVLIFGLDCMVRLVSQARPLTPMHIR